MHYDRIHKIHETQFLGPTVVKHSYLVTSCVENRFRKFREIIDGYKFFVMEVFVRTMYFFSSHKIGQYVLNIFIVSHKCGPCKTYAAGLNTPDEVWSLEEVSIFVVCLGRFAPFAK